MVWYRTKRYVVFSFFVCKTHSRLILRTDMFNKLYVFTSACTIFPHKLSRRSGRFGIVKKCVHLDTATHYCAKYVKTRLSQKEEAKKEVHIMNELRHPRLIRLYEAFEEPRQIVLILEL